MIVVGLHGPMRSGKDTAAQFIIRWAAERGVFAIRRGFSDLLKLSTYRLFEPECTLDEAVDWCNEFKFRGRLVAEPSRGRFEKGDDGEWLPETLGRYEINGRQLLQRNGTEAHRDVFDQNFWVDALLPVNLHDRNEAVCKFLPPYELRTPDLVLITDLRFVSEAERIREIGGFNWRIVRKDLEQSDTHISEQPLPDRLIDYTFDQHDGLAEFEQHLRVKAAELDLQRTTS